MDQRVGGPRLTEEFGDLSLTTPFDAPQSRRPQREARLYPLVGPLRDLRYQEVWKWDLRGDTSYMEDRDQIRELRAGMAQLGKVVCNIHMMFGCFFKEVAKDAWAKDQAELQYILNPNAGPSATMSAPPNTVSSGQSRARPIPLQLLLHQSPWQIQSGRSHSVCSQCQEIPQVWLLPLPWVTGNPPQWSSNCNWIPVSMAHWIT